MSWIRVFKTHCSWQNWLICDCITKVPIFLIALSNGQFSAPQDHTQFPPKLLPQAVHSTGVHLFHTRESMSLWLLLCDSVKTVLFKDSWSCQPVWWSQNLKVKNWGFYLHLQSPITALSRLWFDWIPEESVSMRGPEILGFILELFLPFGEESPKTAMSQPSRSEKIWKPVFFKETKRKAVPLR